MMVAMVVVMKWRKSVMEKADREEKVPKSRLHKYLFVFHIAETILRDRIDRFREKGRTCSHTHLFPISTNNPSHLQNTNTKTNTNTKRGEQVLISTSFTSFYKQFFTCSHFHSSQFSTLHCSLSE